MLMTETSKGILWLIFKLVAQKCCLMKGKDCLRFVFFIIFLFKFWGFCTVLLLITKNIGNATLIHKIISQCSFILFEHANFIHLLLQIFSIYPFDKLLLQISVLYLCYKILTLSWLRSLSNRNQSIDMLRKSVDCFLYDDGPRHERS